MAQQNQIPTIPVQLLPQLTEMQSTEEDWTGLTSQSKRRKLQNRLNQRARRRRQNNDEPRPEQNNSTDTRFDAADIVHCRNLDAAPFTSELMQPRCSLGRPETRDFLTKFARQALECYRLGMPNVNHLTDTIRFNVFHAFVRNAQVLGFDDAWLTYEAISPFNKQGPPKMQDPSRLSYPANMRPTPLQELVEHHPWIDFFPCHRMRDNFLRAVLEYGEDAVDEDTLCHDMLDGGAAAGTESAAILAWAEPWSPEGWEVSERFLQKWGWILWGCVELQAATNNWRQRRGLSMVRFPGC